MPVNLTVLGSGDAFGSRGRFQSGYIIEGGRGPVLMEAGPAILTQLKRTAIAPDDIDVILISHLHGDHFAGLPFLALEYLYESPRRRNLTIAGPPGLQRRTWEMMRAMYRGFDPEDAARKFRWIELKPGKAARVAGMKITSIRTPHTSPDFSLALRIEIDGKTIAFSGDSGWTDEMVPFVAGADLFLCECTYFDKIPPAYLTRHMNYPQLAANRGLFDVKRMVLTHLGWEVIDRESELRIETATDGMRIEI